MIYRVYVDATIIIETDAETEEGADDAVDYILTKIEKKFNTRIDEHRRVGEVI